LAERIQSAVLIRRPYPDEIHQLPQNENAADRRFARIGLVRGCSSKPGWVTQGGCTPSCSAI
jgi:hypothetical protein